MNQLALDLTAVRERRDRGLDAVARKAGDDWSRRARGYLLEWLCVVGPRLQYADGWLAEDFREWAFGRGLAAPHDGRAFGKVMRSACMDGIIVRCGYAPARSSNLSPKCLWRAA